MTVNQRERERNARVERWLRADKFKLANRPSNKLDPFHGGGTVLAANERAARAIAAAFHTAQRAEGVQAWPTPAIYSWDGWIREQWLKRNSAGLMLLNSLQEHSLWLSVIHRSNTGRALRPLFHATRLATTAQQAYRFLVNYAPGTLNPSARVGWLGDPAIFDEWLTDFESVCRRDRLISGSRLAVDLTLALISESLNHNGVDAPRSPLLLIGFDRLLESQSNVLDAWGEWKRDEPESAPEARDTQFYAVPDSAAELTACASWLREKLRNNADARLLVVTPSLDQRRGELGRALLALPQSASSEADAPLDFEFSLGVPLARVGVARSALLLLRWLAGPLTESEVDWLLTSGQCAASQSEETRLAEAMLSLREQGMERPEWDLEDFLRLGAERVRVSQRTTRTFRPIPPAFAARFAAARERLRFASERQSPLEFVSLASDLLKTLGWPGFRPESTVTFQARERWETVLDDCGSLGFDEPQMDWGKFLMAIAQSLSTTIFATESSGAPIQITGPMESAGQLANAIWFLGAQEEDWPARDTPHPFLPASLQRETAMPHASPAADWELAHQTTRRLLDSADEVIFSYAELSSGLETRPSRLVSQLLDAPSKMPVRFIAQAPPEPLTECFEDRSQIVFTRNKIDGGAATLTSQSHCAFQAFATTRLGAGKWQAAETGLNPRQRGQLLHAVLQRVWGGSASGGIRTLAELQAIGSVRDTGLSDFVRPIVDAVLRENSALDRYHPFAARFPQRYLALEAERLTRLVAQWLDYERSRLPFRVLDTEAASDVTIAGLELHLRIDRIDHLEDGAHLIIDYKTGQIGPSAWAGERPDDMQLPLYATFASDQDQARLEGLVFARLRPGKFEFCGRVMDASNTLLTGLGGQNGLLKDPLTAQQLNAWREVVERLAHNFLNGRADVNPKDGVKTCERCHLHAVCRVYESQPLALELAGTEEDEPEFAANGEAEDA